MDETDMRTHVPKFSFLFAKNVLNDKNEISWTIM